MAKRRLLTTKRLSWAENRDVNLKGTALREPITVAATYSKKLSRLTEYLEVETMKALRVLFRVESNKGQDSSISNKVNAVLNKLESQFTELFRQKAATYAKNMVSRSEKASKSSLHSSLKQLSGGMSLETGIMNSDTRDAVTAIINENVNLIKSIPQEYMAKIRSEIFRTIVNKENEGLEGLENAIYHSIKSQAKNARRRAYLIATDQTRKTYNKINQLKLLSLGIEKFEWVHSGGGSHPRVYHRDVLNGNIYLLTDPPVIDPDTGERGIPGQLINCRCTMLPVVSFEKG